MTQEQNTEKKYPIGGFAPGYYQCRCVNCKQDFMGDKRSVQCEPCAEKSVAAQPNEQNTATSADKVLTELFPYDRDNFSRLMTTQAIEHYHASKLKELSEKGEPTDEEINVAAIEATRLDRGDYGNGRESGHISGAEWVRNRLSTVIAALRAENKKKDEEIASLRAQLETTNWTIASLQTQLEKHPAAESEVAFARWIMSTDGQCHLKAGHSIESARKFLYEGGKAHE